MARDHARRLVRSFEARGQRKGIAQHVDEARISGRRLHRRAEAGRGPAREGALHRPHPPADARGRAAEPFPCGFLGHHHAQIEGDRIEAGRKADARAAGFGGGLMFGDLFGHPTPVPRTDRHNRCRWPRRRRAACHHKAGTGRLWSAPRGCAGTSLPDRRCHRHRRPPAALWRARRFRRALAPALLGCGLPSPISGPQSHWHHAARNDARDIRPRAARCNRWRQRR